MKNLLSDEALGQIFLEARTSDEREREPGAFRLRSIVASERATKTDALAG
jgi:hypothetical protein